MATQYGGAGGGVETLREEKWSQERHAFDLCDILRQEGSPYSNVAIRFQ
jgi:hypothetical protein